MKTLLSILSLSLLSTANLLAQGNIVPTTAPNVPIMKTLDQVEARRPVVAGTPGVGIGGFGSITISQPGSYYLTGNVLVTLGSGHGITISSSDVTLDLNGFTISSNGSGGMGINLAGADRTFIYNGHIRGNHTYSGGSFTGNQLTSGIDYTVAAPGATRVKDVTVEGVGSYGIDLGTGEASIVESCVVRTAQSVGIRAGIVTDSAALQIGNNPISATTALNCIGKKADGTPTTSTPNTPQADQRVPISSLPYSITDSGSYYLTKNLSIATGTAITITGATVTLDLNGFTISSTAASPTGHGVFVDTLIPRNVKILNGNIVGVTNGGFSGGIYSIAGNALLDIRAIHVNAVQNGINGNQSQAMVENCSARSCAGLGIKATMVKDCYVSGIGDEGIRATTVIGCVAFATGVGISGSVVDSSSGLGSTGINSTNVTNSYGSGTNAGISGISITNSSGFVSAANGIGINGSTILNCYGNAAGGDALRVSITSGVITNSFGITLPGGSGVGLRAFTANGSRGETHNGGAVSQVITNKYNMP